MERERVTMAQVVGANVRKLRVAQRRSQDELRIRLRERGVTMARPTVAQLEAGGRPTSVDELLALGLALGVAPHLLLYPPAGTYVAVGDSEIQGWFLADWLSSPDDHPFTSGGQAERRWWVDSYAERLSDLPPEDLEEFRRWKVMVDEAAVMRQGSPRVPKAKSGTKGAPKKRAGRRT